MGRGAGGFGGSLGGEPGPERPAWHLGAPADAHLPRPPPLQQGTIVGARTRARAHAAWQSALMRTGTALSLAISRILYFFLFSGYGDELRESS